MNEEFISKIESSAKYLFDSANMITLYDNNDKVVKGLIFNSNPKTAYYVIKEKNHYSLYYSRIFSYVLTEHNTDKDILSHTFSYGGIKEDEKLEYYSVYPILKYKEERNLDIPIPADLFKMTDKEIKEYLISARLILVPKLTIRVAEIRKYVDMYSTYNDDLVITDDSLILSTQKNCLAYQPKMIDIGLRFKFINKLEQYTKENQFEYNDLDNYIWHQDGYILIEDQNIIFVCKFIDSDNFKINSIIRDEIPDGYTEEEYIDYSIKNFECVSFVKNNILMYENGKISFIDESFYYIFELDIVYGINAIEEELGNSYLEDSDIDTTSVKYMRDYLYTLYDYNRFAFCNQVFLVLGSGYEYNPNKGSYESSDSQYRDDLKDCPLDCKASKNLYGPFNDYIKISYLNDEWKEELKWFYNKIKELPEDTKLFGDRYSIQQILESIEPFIQ